MKILSTLLILFLSLTSANSSAGTGCHELLDFSATKLRSSEQINFCEHFAGKTMLVVNTASQCGFTSQFKDLEKLNKAYGDELAIVGFPSNDFKQEHADSEKVADVCYVNYGVTFTMLEPSAVKGEQANELFKGLSQRTGQQPSWNFNKYLISADGETVQHFSSSTKPMGEELRGEIDKLIASK